VTKIRIQSNFKDYYDYIAWQYGGGDPKFVYLRHRSVDTKKIMNGEGEFPRSIEVPNLPFKSRRWYDWLFFCGDAYLMDEGKVVKYVDPTPCGECFHCRGKWKWGSCIERYTGSVDRLKAIAMKYNEPVFQCTSGLGAGEFWIPTLKDIGFDKIETDPEKVYHRIEDYKRNVLTPVVEISGTMQSDKEKTVSHGFDVKQSFRHRM